MLVDRIYFAADDGVHGVELWISDGTAAGTHLVKDTIPGAASSYPRHLTAVGHLLIFAAADGTHGLEPWKSDGTAAGTAMIQDVAPGDPSRELYVLHTDRERLDIGEIRWLGLRLAS